MFAERCPINRWPGTVSAYMLMRDDRAVGESWAWRYAVARIGAQVGELDGGHSPFFSRPAELSAVLLGLSDSDIHGDCGRGDEF